MSKKPVMLCIMDGFGWTPDETYGNAVAAANKPNLDKIFANYPMTTIEASGMAVGLPDGQMGNSEVGHTNMGAGRIVYQQLTLITKSIKDGEMFKNPVLVKNMKAAIDAGKAIHLMGLVGTGGVHSHADHWFGGPRCHRYRHHPRPPTHTGQSGRPARTRPCGRTRPRGHCHHAGRRPQK